MRNARKKAKGDEKAAAGIKFCFVEFADEEACDRAHAALQSATFGKGTLYVDYVGQKAKVKVKQPFKAGSKRRVPINPCRLLVTGLPKSVAGNVGKLKSLFRGCSDAVIPRRSLERSGGTYGFVHFRGPAEAKQAFDAAQRMEVDGARVTVVYAKFEKRELASAEQKVRGGGMNRLGTLNDFFFVSSRESRPMVKRATPSGPRCRWRMRTKSKRKLLTMTGRRTRAWKTTRSLPKRTKT